MKIGIIGLGVVGSACKFGFEKLGHKVDVHDIKLNSKLDDVVKSEIIFICVPTPQKDDGSCDTSIVEKVVFDIEQRLIPNCVYKDPIIVIKSTVSPGTTRNLQEKTKMKICFCPEFLRERCSITDFTENHDLCVIGTDDKQVYNIIKKAHGKLPKKFVHLTPDEAEFVKYFNNSFNAVRIIFANSFYEICKKYNVDYTAVKDAVTNIKHIPHNYLECNENMKGFGGMCLPKDVSALNKMAEGTNVEFFKHILEENKKYKTTVFEGMRK